MSLLSYDARYLVWFSCGISSAVSAKVAVDTLHDLPVEILYCDTFKYEHPDNPRFLADVEKWIDREIKIIRSAEYTDIWDVFAKTNFLKGPNGARCTTELKKKVREAYQTPDDINVLGFAADEQSRIDKFNRNFPDIFKRWVLRDAGLTKQDCFRIVNGAGIRLPAM